LITINIDFNLIANFVNLQIGSLVFLSIELYQEVIATGKREDKIVEQSDHLAEQLRVIIFLKDIMEKNRIIYDKSIDSLIDKNKTLITGPKETRLLSIKDFLSVRFFGSILTALLNSLVIILYPILDIITATVTAAIPIVAWVASTRLNEKTQFLENILSYLAVSTILGQVTYFAFIFAIQRDVIIWSFDGLLFFSIGFSIAMAVLSTGFFYNFIKEIRGK
jgi:hypothetical protein